MNNGENNKLNVQIESNKEQNTGLPIIIGGIVFGVIILVGILMFSYVLKSKDYLNDNVEYNEQQTNDNEDKITEEQNDKTANNTNDEKNIIVGESKYGYISIPKGWNRFYDISGTTALQYSYANIFIVSLNCIEGNQYTAKEYASNFMYNMMNSSQAADVTGATVLIGKNKEYTAYQVYMYYPSENIFLITYWFDAGDGKVRYIALEGPAEVDGMKISDYLYIAESFSLTK